jgi:hypothetical protein
VPCIAARNRSRCFAASGILRMVMADMQQ